MKKFNIYTHELLPTQIVKEGWGWPAFFFNIFWALAKKMWGVFFISWGVYIFAYGIALFVFSSNIDEFSLADIVPVVFTIIFGMEGNNWRVNRLNKLGYKLSDSVDAQNYKIALNKYRAKAPPSNVKEKKYTTSPGLVIDSEGVPSKIKAKSSTSKEKSQGKSISKELPKENQKSKTPISDNDSEYASKLKEAKSLLNDELINKADYEKIKKKIIDSF